MAVEPTEGPRASREEEFTRFMRANHRQLQRTAWLLCGDSDRAEEMTQQALVRTYVAWPRARTNPAAYARRVVANLRIDSWRRRGREVLVDPADVPEAAGPVDDRREDRDELERALRVLTPRQRRVVVLRHVLDLSEQEVAADLGISVGTVKSTSSKALAKLRTVMAERPDAVRAVEGDGS
ncbi:MAG: SigE family RNA polymerase sigma factor [Actinomycetales bacterium]|nr:SigE family RNA polymerase sigma factor [Actinomycetales bacterium]